MTSLIVFGSLALGIPSGTQNQDGAQQEAVRRAQQELDARRAAYERLVAEVARKDAQSRDVTARLNAAMAEHAELQAQNEVMILEFRTAIIKSWFMIRRAELQRDHTAPPPRSVNK